VPSQCDLILLCLGNMMLTECLSVTFADREALLIGWGTAVEYGPGEISLFML